MSWFGNIIITLLVIGFITVCLEWNDDIDRN